MRRILVAVTAVALLAAGMGSTYAAPAKARCTGNPQHVKYLSYPVGKQTAKAIYTFPAGPPRGIVVFDHGYGHTMWSWVKHMSRTSRTLGVITITPNYRGQHDFPPARGKKYPSSRGWRVAEGAEDSIAAAQLFEKRCSPKGMNVLYGVSMGGNTAGLVLAAKPKRPDGRPLFDHWVQVEGAANVTETYLMARMLAGSGNATAKNAVFDIEEEMGGPIESRREVYAERTVVNRVDDIAGSGIKTVSMVHGVADGLVSYDHSRQLQALLIAHRIPVDFWSAVTRSGNSESGTTIDGYLPTGHDSPFAGHASEASETHDVGLAGFAALTRLYRGQFYCGETAYDGMTGQRLYGLAAC